MKKSFSDVLRMKNPSAPCHIWLILFHDYLQSLAGKALTKMQADQHASEIYLMLQSIGPTGTEIACITDSQGKAMWELAKPLLNEKKKRPATINSYLPSLDKFYKFIIHSQDEEDPTLQVTPALLKSVKTAYDLAAWRAVIRKHYKDDEWRRQLVEMKSRLWPEDIRDINQTKPAKKADTLS